MYHFLYTDFSITLQCEKGQDYTGLSVSKGIHRYVSLERGYMTSWGIHDVRKNARENLGLIKTAIEKKMEKKEQEAREMVLVIKWGEGKEGQKINNKGEGGEGEG
jgi:hypothetical protein